MIIIQKVVIKKVIKIIPFVENKLKSKLNEAKINKKK